MYKNPSRLLQEAFCPAIQSFWLPFPTLQQIQARGVRRELSETVQRVHAIAVKYIFFQIRKVEYKNQLVIARNHIILKQKLSSLKWDSFNYTS